MAETSVADTGLFGTALEEQQRKELGLIGFDGQAAEFCPYTATSKNYDKTRRPLGIPVTLGAMMHSKPLSEQSLLDVGSGTGSFLQEVCPKFKECTGLEYNEGMLAQARCIPYANKVTYVQGSADKLPFADASFDGATMNQVSHHFPADENYAFLAQVLREIFRVLRPGGVFVMNHGQRCQDQDGMWWASLMPRTTKQYCDLTCPTDLILQYMADAGFEVSQEAVMVPTHATLIDPSIYLKKHGIEGAFIKEYRDGDSMWAMCEMIGELPDVHAKIRKMQEAGTDAKFLEDREELRKRTGQATFICVRKP